MSETMGKVKAILSKYAQDKAQVEAATEETKLRGDLGVASANLVDVVIDLETAFDISIPDEQVLKIQTLGDVVRMLEAKQAAA